jgi:serine/threonine-protein kinase
MVVGEVKGKGKARGDDVAMAKTMPGEGSAPTLTSSSAPEAPAASADVPAPGELIDRFVVIEQIGAGGMAVVVSAQDPDLDRKVAIKLLRAEVWRGDRTGTQGRQRLLREAQAMARLAHPNVVAVHQVGTWRDQVYVAMEHVDGQTLGAWLDEKPRGWREVVDVFVQAGRGLAAAHRAGLVHRDFKPDNVLIGRDGRVRVGDFGLVSTAGAPVEETPVPVSSGPLTPIPLSSSLTRTGMVLGTPAYMPPEQHERKPVDARADQFAFCVALHQGLYGDRPFPGDTYDALLDSIRHGRVREPPAATLVPPRLRQVILRGLEYRAEDRFASMDELLDALTDDPDAARRGRRRALAVAGAFVTLGAVTVFALARGPAPARPCAGARAELAGVWDGARRSAVERAFAASGRSHAADTFTRAARALDGYGDAWVAMRTEACEATRVHGRQSESVLDLRMRCLDRRRAAVGALTELLATRGDAEVVDRALDAVAALPPVAGCADVDALSLAVPPPHDPAVRRAVEATTVSLDHAEALFAAGKIKDALPLARSAADDARGAGHAPTTARALFLLGRVQASLGDAAAAETALGEALRAAAAAHDDALVLRAWIALIDARGVAGRYEEALALRTPAEVALARAGDADELRAGLLGALGTTEWNLGHYPEAQALLERALALRERRRGPDHPEVAETLETLGNVLADQGRYPEAQAALERALAIRERESGPRHPRTGAVLNDLAMVLRDQGRHAEALPLMERALAIFEESLGPDAADVARIHNNLGLVHAALGHVDQAVASFRRALAGKEKSLGAEHPSTALTLNNLAAELLEHGRADEAEPLARRAVAVYETALGKDHPEAARAHNTLGGVLRAKGQCREAREHFATALAIWEKKLGPEHQETTYAMLTLGSCELVLGRPAAALALFERALAVRAKEPGRAGQLAEARWQVARTLVVLGRDRPRALALAAEARDGYRQTGARHAADAEAIDAWLAAGAPPARVPGASWQTTTARP